MNLDSRLQKLESMVGDQTDAALAAEEQRFFYRGLHGHLAGDAPLSATAEAISSFFFREQAELHDEESPASPARHDPEWRNEFRGVFIEHGRHLDSQGVPSLCDCPYCRPVTGAAAVDYAEVVQ